MAILVVADHFLTDVPTSLGSTSVRGGSRFARRDAGGTEIDGDGDTEHPPRWRHRPYGGRHGRDH